MKMNVMDEKFGKMEIYKNDKGEYRLKFLSKPDFEPFEDISLTNDKDYGFYFIIGNPYKGNEKRSIDKILNDDNMKDMVQALRDGYCDVFQKGFFGSMHAIRFILRDKGEELRKKSLEGWKDTKFCYAIRISNGFNKNFMLDKDFNRLLFNSEEEASNYLKEYFEKSYRHLEKEYLNEFDEFKKDFFKSHQIVISVK